MSSMKVGISVQCTTCGRTKAPIGRSVPHQLDLCDRDCPGNRQDPIPGSLWPGETEADYGYPVSSIGTKEVMTTSEIEEALSHGDGCICPLCERLALDEEFEED